MQEPLTDTKLKIIPSQSLIDAINSIESPENLTPGLCKFHKKFKPTRKSVPLVFKTFSTTNEQFEFIQTLRNENENTEIEPKKFLDINLDEKVDETGKIHLQIEDLKCLKEHLTNGTYLHELLKDCTIYVPQNNVRPRNPQLEERCVKLRARQKNLEYRAMTKNVDNYRARLPEDTVAFQVKEINKQLIAVAQFIMSVLAGFAFGFLGVELAVGHLDFGFRLLLGIICALIIALAEIYFLAKKLNEYSDFLDKSKLDDGLVFPSIPVKREVKSHQD